MRTVFGKYGPIKLSWTSLIAGANTSINGRFEDNTDPVEM